jgi:AcrR family transcriptional regulator
VRKLDPQKHEARVRDILEAAARCFARDGFRGASISSLCAAANISPGHLYHYFDSKEAIVKAMIETAVAEADLELDLLAVDGDPIAPLISKVLSGRAAQRDATHFLLFDMLAEAGHNPAIAKLLRDHNRATRAKLATLLRNGQDHGYIDRTLDPDLAASILISAIDGTKAMNIRDPKLNKEAASEHLAMLITRFLAPQKA